MQNGNTNFVEQRTMLNMIMNYQSLINMYETIGYQVTDQKVLVLYQHLQFLRDEYKTRFGDIACCKCRVHSQVRIIR